MLSVSAAHLGGRVAHDGNEKVQQHHRHDEEEHHQQDDSAQAAAATVRQGPGWVCAACEL